MSSSTPRLWMAPLCVGLALAAVFATQYAGALSLPLMTDDYLILAKTRSASLVSMWAPVDLLSGFYRPWGRELHFWTLDRLFGADALAFHLASFLLWLSVMGLFFSLVRRLAGTAVAALATCLAGTQAAWAVLLVWSAGSQDLWMMVSGLLFLVAFVHRRTAWAAIALAISLLSKETAATLPLIAALYARIVERRTIGGILRHTAVLWPVVAVWALMHPLLGGALRHGPSPLGMHGRWDGLAKLAATARALVNADLPLQPTDGWWQVLLTGLPAAALLGAAVLMAFRMEPAEARRAGGAAENATPAPRRVAVWAGSWALLGWLPLSMPGLGWHAYYSLWGAFGVWTLVAIALARHRWVGVAVVLGLSLLRPARAWTPEVDLGSEWYHARSAMLTAAVHADLLGRHQTLPAHSRVFLAGVPGGVGLLPSPGHCPALEVWYGDPTLRGYFFSQYAPRAAGDTLGRDYFFVFDSTGHSTEIIAGREDVSHARGDPHWRRRHLELAALFFTHGDRAACVAEFEKMVSVFPEDPVLRFDLGACHESMGDRPRAERSYRAAFALPGATPAMLETARVDWGGPP